jgi:pimeloyl-ACP methyl ester carboxylesterase
MNRTRRSIVNDGVDIVFDECGTGRPTIWLHGLSEDRHSWSPVTDLLPPGLRCLRMDFRGHGESAHRGPYDFSGLVSDLGAVIRDTCDEPPVVVGHSLGGMVATIGAVMGMTGPVVCIDQPLALGDFGVLVHRLAPRLRDPDTFADALMEEKVALGMDLVPEPIFEDLERKARASDHEVVVEIWKPMLDGDFVEPGIADWATQMLGAIDVPYLALHGHSVVPGYDEWFHATNRDATYERWDGLGHWLHLVDSPRFVRRFEEFLAPAA